MRSRSILKNIYFNGAELEVLKILQKKSKKNLSELVRDLVFRIGKVNASKYPELEPHIEFLENERSLNSSSRSKKEIAEERRAIKEMELFSKIASDRGIKLPENFRDYFGVH